MKNEIDNLRSIIFKHEKRIEALESLELKYRKDDESQEETDDG
jgi:hypothetical protein